MHAHAQVLANVSDENSPLLDSFASSSSARFWRDCCEAAEHCCQAIAVDAHVLMNGTIASDTCPPTWDGWQCWPDGGAPGETVHASCPGYIYFGSSVAAEDGVSSGACGREFPFPPLIFPPKLLDGGLFLCSDCGKILQRQRPLAAQGRPGGRVDRLHHVLQGESPKND